MMKTTATVVALAAVAATTEAALYVTKMPIEDVKKLEKCAPATDLVITSRMATPNALGQYMFDIVLAERFQVSSMNTLDAVSDCTTAAGATTSANVEACLKGTTVADWAWNTGLNAACPVAYGAACTEATTTPVAAAQVCQNKDNGDVKCSTSKICLYDIYPAKAFEVEWESKLHYKDAKNTMPSDISTAIGAAFTESKCTIDPAFPKSTWQYPTNRKGTKVVNGQGVTGDCKVETFKTAVDAAIKKYNEADANKDKKFTGTYTAKLDNFQTKCQVPTTAAVACKTTTDCTIPCADAVTCEKDDVCGSTWCRETTTAFMVQADPKPVAKQCFSNAVVSVVAPVIAAAFAIALF